MLRYECLQNIVVWRGAQNYFTVNIIASNKTGQVFVFTLTIRLVWPQYANSIVWIKNEHNIRIGGVFFKWISVRAANIVWNEMNTGSIFYSCLFHGIVLLCDGILFIHFFTFLFLSLNFIPYFSSRSQNITTFKHMCTLNEEI